MKKHLIWLLVGLLALVLGTYGLQYLDGKITMPLFANNNVQVETNAKALEVDNLISKISTPVTLDSEQAIKDARAQYDALSAADKLKVTKLTDLEAAEAKLAELKGSSTVTATSVDDLIGKISNPVTLDSEAAIVAARSAYDSLSDTEKAKVTKLSILEDAEAKLAELKGSSTVTSTSVDDLIGKISNPVTLDSEAAIAAARSAYDSLSDTEKAKVTKLSILEDAEAALAKLKAGTSTTTSYAEGDIVTFLGGNVYVSSFATDPASEIGKSQCQVTIVASDAAHPYHLISTDGAGVYGWVDAERIQK